jgi:hypothetical protein
MKVIKEYYKLYCSTYWRLLKTSIGWRDIILLVLSLLIGSVGSYWWKGKDFMLEQVFSFVAYSMLPFGILALVYGAYFLIQTPVKIYQSQKSELSKYNWDEVLFEVAPFSIVGMSGWAIRIVNNKQFDLCKIQIRLNQVRINRDVHPARKAYYFGSIDYASEEITYLEDKGIERGKAKDFVITGIVQGSFTPIHKFVTFPTDDINFPFYDLPIPPFPQVVIDIDVRGFAEFRNEKSILPAKTISIEIKHNGSILIAEPSVIEKAVHR